jgi:hypothetical protein
MLYFQSSLCFKYDWYRLTRRCLRSKFIVIKHYQPLLSEDIEVHKRTNLKASPTFALLYHNLHGSRR